MKEAFFILVVIAVLMGLTAIRNRRQIAAMISIWKQLKATRERIRDVGGPRSQTRKESGIQLVNCARCGKWLPENEALFHPPSSYICARSCELSEKRR